MKLQHTLLQLSNIGNFQLVDSLLVHMVEIIEIIWCYRYGELNAIVVHC